jgi:hypothetical protein
VHTSLRNSIIMVSLAVAALPAHAGDKNYDEALNAYHGEIVREPLEVKNTSFYGLVAESQAKRALLRDGSNGNDINADVNSSRNSRDDGSVNVASPQIFGTVRGNVNIVVERGAIRGNITSVRRR